MDPAGRSLTRTLALYAVPLAGSQALTLFGNTVSKALLTHLIDTKALATSALPLPWVGLCIAVISGVTYGAMVLVSRARSRETRALQMLCAQALGTVFIIGIVCAAAGMLFAPQILRLQSTPQALWAVGIPYVRIEAAILPLTFLYMMYGTIREALGDSRTPFLMLLAYIVIYVALMPPLMIGAGVFPRMGTLAAPVAQLVAIGVVVGATAATFRIPYRIPSRDSLHGMLLMDFPISAQYAGVAVGNLVIFRFANGQGVASVAAYTAMLTVLAYVGAPAAVFSAAAGVFGGSALGDGRLTDARRILRLTFFATCGASAALTLGLYAFAPQVLRTMVSGDARTLAMHALAVCLWSVPALNAGTIVCAFMRAGRQTVAPMITTLAGVWALQIPLTWWLSAHGDAMAVWRAYATAYVAIGAAQVLYFGLGWAGKNMGAADAAPMPA